jgi:hypothetical protein
VARALRRCCGPCASPRWRFSWHPTTVRCDVPRVLPRDRRLVTMRAVPGTALSLPPQCTRSPSCMLYFPPCCWRLHTPSLAAGSSLSRCTGAGCSAVARSSESESHDVCLLFVQHAPASVSRRPRHSVLRVPRCYGLVCRSTVAWPHVCWNGAFSRFAVALLVALVHTPSRVLFAAVHAGDGVAARICVASTAHTLPAGLASAPVCCLLLWHVSMCVGLRHAPARLRLGYQERIGPEPLI